MYHYLLLGNAYSITVGNCVQYTLFSSIAVHSLRLPVCCGEDYPRDFSLTALDTLTLREQHNMATVAEHG